jgi:predicted Zn-dependent peptidase
MSEMITLKNGLRLVLDKVTEVETAAFGIWAGIGTRHEDLNDNGAAHMVEHMLFKGTKTRNAMDISSEIEAVGGNMNAYTGREITGYYCHLLKDDLGLAVDVLSDMILNSTMPEDEIERERGVILQELKMYQDAPDDLVMDYFSEASYPNQSLGSNGLGTPDTISNIHRDVLMGYVSDKYTPDHLVISVSGNFDETKITNIIEGLFADLPKGKTPYKQRANYNPTEKLVKKDTEQTHIMLGFEAPHRHHKDYQAMRVLATILGGGMSSRLFQEIREKRGLVYSISSTYDVVSDAGIIGFYAGTGHEHVKELMPAALNEFKKNANDLVSDEELKRAKSQIKTSVLMSRERIMSRCDQNARSMIHYGSPYNPKEFIIKTEEVTADDIRRVMMDALKTKPVVAAIGDIDNIMNQAGIIDFMKA